MAPKNKSKKLFWWLEEYQHCSCSTVAKTREELLGYCPRHATDKKYRIRVPAGSIDLGFVEA